MKCDVAVIILLHSHVPLDVALEAVDAKVGVLALITCPCCQFVEQHTSLWDRPPDIVYADASIVSERREVRLWCQQLGSEPLKLPLAAASDVVLRKRLQPPKKTGAPQSRYTEEQAAELEAEYARNSRPNNAELKELAARIGLEWLDCSSWFKAHRGSEYRRNKATDTADRTDRTGSTGGPGASQAEVDPIEQRAGEAAARKPFAMRSLHRHSIEFASASSAESRDVAAARDDVICAAERCERNSTLPDAPTNEASSSAMPMLHNLSAQVREACACGGGMTVHGIVGARRPCRKFVFFWVVPTACTAEIPYSAKVGEVDRTADGITIVFSPPFLTRTKIDSNAACQAPPAAEVPEIAGLDRSDSIVNAWKRGVRVGDAIEVTGVPGRSQAGSPVLFCWRLVIIGESYSRIEL